MQLFAAIGLVALAAATTAWAAPSAPHPTVAAIKASIAREGAAATVSELFDQRRWDEVAAHIARGDDDWVALAVGLARGTDAGTAEDLTISLALALPRNARAVLAAAQGGAGAIADVCGAPFIEGTVRDVPGYKRQAAAAVARITDPRLALAKAACLETLAKPA